MQHKQPCKTATVLHINKSSCSFLILTALSWGITAHFSLLSLSLFSSYFPLQPPPSSKPLHPPCHFLLNAFSFNSSIYFIIYISTSQCPFQLFLSSPSLLCLTKSVVVVRQGALCLRTALVWIHASVCTSMCVLETVDICMCDHALSVYVNVCGCMYVCICVCMFKHAWAEPWGQSSFVLPTISQRWMCLQGTGPRRKAPPAHSY